MSEAIVAGVEVTQQRMRISRSCSCIGSSAPTGRAMKRCISSTAPSSRSGPGSRWRWWRLRAPASRRCCTSPVCSSTPTHGDVYIDGRATAILSDAERTRIRRNEIGFVYQSHHLLPEFTALENVHAAADDPRPGALGGQEARGRAARLSRSCRTALPIGRPSSPAASSSASPSRARSPMRRASSWPTSRPEISICTQRTMCSRL